MTASTRMTLAQPVSIKSRVGGGVRVLGALVKGHDTVPRKTSGYHGGKKITGRGRHLAVDTEGWLLALVVTAASVSDKAGAKNGCVASDLDPEPADVRVSCSEALF